MLNWKRHTRDGTLGGVLAARFRHARLRSAAMAKKRAGLLRLSGDEVTYALTQALRRVMRPT